MLGHLRANLMLLALTLILCCVVYPALLLGVGHLLFPAQAEGSLVRDAKGAVVGSRLIAQPFTKDEYLWPRPSAAGNGYDASASGGSNLGASNPKLRDRVARQLGSIAVYRFGDHKGQPVGPDVEKWLTPEVVRKWAADSPDAAGWWIDADKANKKMVEDWQAKNPDAVAAWRKDNPSKAEPAAADLAVSFFAAHAGTKPATWPEALHGQVQSVFFDAWRTANRDVELEPVPADMVMASGSGLDPHVTLDNARYQVKYRVADARAKMVSGKRGRDEVEADLLALLDKQASAPFGGLVGVPLVNVLEFNLALDAWAAGFEKSAP